MDIKPIRTPDDHQAALAEIRRLWDIATPGTPEGDAFEVLATLVDAYEREHHPVPPPDPIEAIRFRMEQSGLDPKDLNTILEDKSRARASEILGRKRRLNLKMIRRLHAKLSIPLEVLVRDYKLKKARPGKRKSAAA